MTDTATDSTDTAGTAGVPLMLPRVDDADVRARAEHVGVCIRPVIRRLVDTHTGQERHVPIPCGSTRERVCKPCADKARAVRMQQCREGWHGGPAGIDVPDLCGLSVGDARADVAALVTLSHPHVGPLPAPVELEVAGERYGTEVDAGTVLDQTPAPDDRIAPGESIAVIVAVDEPRNQNDTLPAAEEEFDDEAQPSTARRRSTRRRQDMPDLPKPERRQSSQGRAFDTHHGRIRPGMFCTLTLDSYGPVHSDSKRGCACGDRHTDHDSIHDSILGTPVNMNSYDYDRAARDALHLPKLFDHWIKVVRRIGGYHVQYFAAVEPQRRLALHIHVAMRGTIPRATMRDIAEATYYHLWWPKHDKVVYPAGRTPTWSDAAHDGAGGYLDPATGVELPTWDQAVDAITEPAHKVTFGRQFDYQGIAPTNHRELNKSVRYLTKYICKSVAETHDPHQSNEHQREHRRRLHNKLRWLPCTETCPNWLRYGVQPKNAEPGQTPGDCGKAAHHLDNLGHGGRRVLVSRQWSGKRVPQHRADRARVVKAALSAAGIDMPDTRRYAADTTTDGRPRYHWEPVNINTGQRVDDYLHLIRRTIQERIRWRRQYDAAKDARAARAGPRRPPRLPTQCAAVAA